MKLNEWEMKALAVIVVACIGLSIVNYWFSPKGWIGIRIEQSRKPQP